MKFSNLGGCGVFPDPLGILRVRQAVQLEAQLLEARILLRDLCGQLADIDPCQRPYRNRQQPHTLPEQRKTLRLLPGLIGEHGQHHLSGRMLFILILHGAAIITRLPEHPAVIDADQKAFEQNLPEFIQPGLRAGELLRIGRRQHIGNQIPLPTQAEGLLIPCTILFATAMLTASALARWQLGTIVAKPLNLLERAAWILLHPLDRGARIALALLCRQLLRKEQAEA